MTIPECKYCGQKLKRWGWYFDPEHPVYYWYRACGDTAENMRGYGPDVAPLTAYLVILPKGATEG